MKEGSTSIAFANVAFVLEHLQSATFDVTMDMAGPDTTITMRRRGLTSSRRGSGSRATARKTVTERW